MTGSATRAPSNRRIRAFSPARRGFSLVEMLIVAVLLGLIAAFAVPRVNYERYRADAAMRTLRVVLQGAQRNAIMRQTNVVVAFDMTNRKMIIVEDANNNCTWDSGERKSVRPLEEGAKFAIPASPYGAPASAAVSGANTCTMLGFPAIQFLRDGAASTDLNAYVTSSRGTSADFRLIRVTMATGRTEAFRYTGTSWTRTN
ncbi:MAG: type II secretion system protein [Gemmatimonadaceae bacterium]